MVKKLFLLRHGHAVSGFNMRDYDRTLSQDGEQTIAALAIQLKAKEIHIDQIICSPAIRTMQTCNILTTGINYEGNVDYVNAIYEATTNQLFQLISETSDQVNDIMLIGHNPGISYLCDYLTTNRNTGMSPGNLIEIHIECDHWNEVTKGSGTIH